MARAMQATTVDVARPAYARAQSKLVVVFACALRQFAMIGALFLNISIFYFTPFAIMSFKIDTFPKYPSYLMAEICGPGTAYACPGRQVPIPKRDSLAIAPNDPRLQQQGTLN